MERDSIQYQGNDCSCSEADLAKSTLLNHVPVYMGGKIMVNSQKMRVINGYEL